MHRAVHFCNLPETRAGLVLHYTEGALFTIPFFDVCSFAAYFASELGHNWVEFGTINFSEIKYLIRV